MCQVRVRVDCEDLVLLVVWSVGSWVEVLEDVCPVGSDEPF